MASIETTILFVAIPAGAWVILGLAVLFRVSRLRARDPVSLPAGSSGRIILFLLATSTSVLFGIVLWVQAAAVTARVGPLPEPESSLFRWVGLSFAGSAVLTIGVQGWIATFRLRQLVGLNFPRVLPFITVASTQVVLSLIVGFLAMNRIADNLLVQAGFAVPQVDSAIIAVQMHGVSGLALLVSTTFASRIPDLSRSRDFKRALLLNDLGIIPSVGAFAWALLQLAPS